MNELNRVMGLYAWAGIGVLLIVLYRIARFYQVSAKEPSHYRWFALPFVLFLSAAVRYAWIGDFAGDMLGDGLMLAAGSSLFVTGYYLLKLMTGDQQ
jgi:hypothetical protein